MSYKKFLFSLCFLASLLGGVLSRTAQRSSLRAEDAPAGTFRTPEGFVVDLVYSVPAAEQGSWVSLCVDPQGRILASDQYGKIYRVTLVEGGEPQVEQLKVNIGQAQGMLCASMRCTSISMLVKMPCREPTPKDLASID